MRRDDPTTLTNRIIRACNVPRGLDLPEITSQVQAAATVVCATARLLVDAGRLHRAGTCKLYRYFAQAHQAAHYAQIFAAEREQILQAKLQRKQDRQNAARRLARRLARGLPPRPPTSPMAQAMRIHGSDIYTARLLELCAQPGGVLCSEIKAAIPAPPGTLSNKLRKLSEAGTLHRRGQPRHYRYFTHQAHADAWQPAKPKRKPAKPKHGPALTIGRSKPKSAGQISIAAATTVTMPPHVQVQRAPTPRDDRFTFTPPPGWKGELTREWEERRAA